MDATFKHFGFVPSHPPATSFRRNLEVSMLDELGRDLPSLLHDRAFRKYVERLDIPPWPAGGVAGDDLPEMRLYYVRLGFLASAYVNHVRDMRAYMPAEHRALIEEVERMPDVRPLADKEPYNDVLEAIAIFRDVHYWWAQEYIQKWVTDPRGTGGTPYMHWLKQLIDETRAAKIA